MNLDHMGQKNQHEQDSSTNSKELNRPKSWRAIEFNGTRHRNAPTVVTFPPPMAKLSLSRLGEDEYCFADDQLNARDNSQLYPVLPRLFQ